MNTLHNQDCMDYPDPVSEQVQRAAVNDSSSSLEIDHPEFTPETEPVDSSTTQPDTPETETTPFVESSSLAIEETTPREESISQTPPVKRNWVSRQIQAVNDSIEEWKHLRREIRAFPARTRERMKEIEKHFMIYRLTFANLTYKAPRIEEEIQEVYNHITNTLPLLKEHT